MKFLNSVMGYRVWFICIVSIWIFHSISLWLAVLLNEGKFFWFAIFWFILFVMFAVTPGLEKKK